MSKDLLLLGANAPEMDLLRARLVRIGYRVVPAKTPDQAHSFLRVAGARLGAVIVPSELPVVNLRGALDAMRRATPGNELVFLGAGRDPGDERRRALRDAGVQLALFDPIDLHTLRFQINRACAGQPAARHRRRTLRAPADWPVVVRSGLREKEGRIYSISATGAFVALAQPWMVRSKVELRIQSPALPKGAATGRVIMTNVPGNVMRRGLPFGMGVQFDHLSDATSVAILMYAESRFRALAV
ncbi:MAG: hypothetical protein DCC71_17625 [Proteobacteria bacterium]|nr:MAG: hypothetical protein DCC71_17625 [Pseudomonadota bacterium]